MKNEFKEFSTLSPYKDFHKNNIVIWSYIGCRHNPTAEKIHPWYRIRVQNGIETREYITRGDLIAEKLRRGLGLYKVLPTDESIVSPEASSVLTALQKSEPLVAETTLSSDL